MGTRCVAFKRLELLGRVVPAFGALMKEFIDGDNQDANLSQDAEDCYSDIVNIGQALSVSRGEWASGLRDEEVTRLLAALDSRFPTRWMPFPFMTTARQNDRELFQMLNDLAKSIESRGLGGYDECLELPSQTSEHRKRYLELMGRDVSLFHKNEMKNDEKRGKFLKRVKEANRHLSDVYYRNISGQDAEEFNLYQHPSHGMKELANRAYHLLERHWKCHCSQRAVREARLSLIRHRQLGPKLPSQEVTRQDYIPAKFEVLLPVCKDSVEWKVTDVEVIKKTRSQAMATATRHSINNDICQLLLDSEGFRVNFLAERDSLWHLTPELLEGIDHYTTMESLHQLLGDGIAISDISKYTPREKLVLCYTLANSMLFLYPGSWFQTAWSSNRVYFVRRVSSATSSVLTFPYLSVELRQAQKVPKNPPHHMQCHSHPVILALGIIFLEIATGARFTRRSHDQEEWKQYNSDCQQAWQQLQELEKQSERDRSKRISPALKKAIRSCLKLAPPADLLSNTLSEEGPIRLYILSCIVQPLALELRDGYKVRLEELHDALVPEKDVENLNESGEQRLGSTRRRPSSTAGDLALATIREDAQPTFSERRELCLLGDREQPVDENKKSTAKKWFAWHDDALCRINEELRKSGVSNAKRVKIAILDSGVDLSPDHKNMYDFEPKMVYRNWIEQDSIWNDDVGHGTHLAVLLRKIAPNAVIHVARVFKNKQKVENAAERIAEAIRYAVDEWRVDIIVMSFGFERIHETLYQAIKHAAYKDVLMFAAASNDGKNRPDGVVWPANEPEVICVHSGDGYGSPSGFTPSPKENMKIMVLGECVSSAWPQKLNQPGDHKHMSGTSCAAPIAAGIAAVILDYARGFLKEEEWESLRRVRSVRRMFAELKDPDNTTGYWWIKHWGLFDPNRDEPWIQGEIRGFFS
ncbi:subtilisin-like protein [Cadophora sp. DSE1049]|nr:subtilisin-like protein [Cadophora sp. DSE1049]